MSDLELTAYLVDSPLGWTIEPCPPTRGWMDEFSHGFAYRCIPLLSGNQIGWVVRCPVGFTATYKNENHAGGIEISFDDNAERWKTRVLSHFGRGVLTFSMPWLFRTAPGYGLLVRGMSNFAKLGAQALDAFVETDWAFSTFTMNWRLLEKERAVRFEVGDPVCQLIPYPRDLIEQFTPRQVRMETNPELLKAYSEWSASRRQFIDRKDRSPTEWQKDYLKGVPEPRPQGGEEGQRQPVTKWELKSF
ncbi:MAG: DUF6065 family protein [Phycisphaerales bacterium]